MRRFIFRLIIILIPFGIGLSLPDCGKEKILVDPVYNFSGTVRDTVSGLPIDSTWIREGDSISTFVRYSDSAGYYDYTSHKFGSYNAIVFCGKTGYDTKVITFYLNKNLNNNYFELSAN
jgi:hypothetical protein